MCSNDIDTSGRSVDPQCMECRELNGPRIAACYRGESGNQGAIQTTKIYRVICIERYDPVNRRHVCEGRGMLDPGQPLPRGARVLLETKSWDEAKRFAERWDE